MVTAVRISDEQRRDLLRLLQDNEKHIAETRELIRCSSERTNDFMSCESAGTYAARLTGYIRERIGMIAMLRALGIEVKWDGDHPVDVVCNHQ